MQLVPSALRHATARKRGKLCRLVPSASKQRSKNKQEEFEPNEAQRRNFF